MATSRITVSLMSNGVAWIHFASPAILVAKRLHSELAMQQEPHGSTVSRQSDYSVKYVIGYGREVKLYEG